MPRQIYRVGGDIYNATTNQRIGATDWGQNWSGQSDVVDLGQRTPSVPSSPVSNLGQTSQSNVYDTSSLNNTGVSVPTPNTSNIDNYSNTVKNNVSSTASSLQSFLSQFDSYTQPAQQERTGLVSKMNTAIDKLVGRSKRTQELMTEQKLPESYEQLKALNLQLAEKQNQINKDITDIGGKAVSKQFMTGRQSEIQRQGSMELGNLATLAQALQGNIELSRQMINDTVNLEYAPIEQEIENLQYQLTINAENMTSAEKKRAEALSISLNERQAQIDAEKQEKTDIKNLAVEAARNGASTDIAQRMMNAKTIGEAMGIGGASLQAGKTQIVNIDGKQKLINTQTGTVIADLGNSSETQVISAGGRQKLINTQTGAVIADLGASDTPSISEQLDAAGEGYTIEGNNIVPNDARTIISQSGQSYDMSTYAADPAQAKAVQGYLNAIGKFNNKEDITAYISNNIPNSPMTADMIVEASNKYKIGWEELVALAQHESILGTSNVSMKNNNPGGVTWSQSYQDSHPGTSKGTARPKAEGGNYVRFNTLQDGLNSVAQQLARRKKTTGGKLSALSQQVYDNPLLMAQLTPTERGKILKEVSDAGLDTSGLAAKALSDTAIKEITQTQAALAGLVDLQSKIKDNLEYIGPIAGFQKLNPWSKARQVQSDVDRIRQVVGKALEGGVLRKEDEEKYKKILATLSDTPETAEYKITQLMAALQQNINDYTELQGLSGRYIPSILNEQTTGSGLGDEEAYQEYLKIIGQ